MEGGAPPPARSFQEVRLSPLALLKPVQWLRTAFIEAVMPPLWLRPLANPRVVAPNLPTGDAPLLIVANHVTAYALPAGP